MKASSQAVRSHYHNEEKHLIEQQQMVLFFHGALSCIRMLRLSSALACRVGQLVPCTCELKGLAMLYFAYLCIGSDTRGQTLDSDTLRSLWSITCVIDHKSSQVLWRCRKDSGTTAHIGHVTVLPAISHVLVTV